MILLFESKEIFIVDIFTHLNGLNTLERQSF
jgi:hypothetical protein